MLHTRNLLGRVEARRRGEPRSGGEEGGEVVCLVAYDGHPLGLEVLQGPGNVEDGLHPRAHHHQGRRSQLYQVSAHVLPLRARTHKNVARVLSHIQKKLL